jgi:uncharacterized protein YgfB (UPF0149 family)
MDSGRFPKMTSLLFLATVSWLRVTAATAEAGCAQPQTAQASHASLLPETGQKKEREDLLFPLLLRDLENTLRGYNVTIAHYESFRGN